MPDPQRLREDLPLLLKLGLRALAILLAGYLCFWVLATAVEHQAKPAGFGTHDHIEYIPLSRRGAPLSGLARQQAEYTPPYRFVSRLWNPEVQGGRLTLSVPQQRDGGQLALMLSARADVLGVRFDGRELQPDIRNPRLSGAFVSEPALYRLPGAAQDGGTGTIEIDVRRSLRDPIIFPDFAIAPLAELRPAFAWRNALAVELPLIGTVLMAFSILLYISIKWPDEDRWKNLTFTGTLAFSGISAAMYLFFDQTRHPLELYSYAITAISFGLAIAAICFAYLDSARRYVSGQTVAGFLVALLMVSILVSLANYNGRPERLVPFNAFITAQLFSTGALVVAAAMLAWEVARGGATRFAERFLLIICFGAIALDRAGPGLFTVNSPFSAATPLSLQWMPMIGSLVGFAMVFILAKHAETARSEILSANARLETRLSKREAELREAYAARERMLAEQVTHQERQRIMRDMHDGLGSNIMSMLLAARRGEAQPERVAEGLQSVIDEMRLMIDSMDSVGESLDSAFAIFRERVRPRVEAAGMQFAWHDTHNGALPHYSPRDVLQVFRILQEAVTNALRHSGGSALAITVAASPDPAFALRLTVSDDGKGMGKPNPRGKGLDGMASRAVAIGGKIGVSDQPGGVVVTLDLPQASIS